MESKNFVRDFHNEIGNYRMFKLYLVIIGLFCVLFLSFNCVSAIEFNATTDDNVTAILNNVSANYTSDVNIINLANGTYNSSNFQTTSPATLNNVKNLTIRGSGNGNTIINVGSAFIQPNNSNITFENINLNVITPIIVRNTATNLYFINSYWYVQYYGDTTKHFNNLYLYNSTIFMNPPAVSMGQVQRGIYCTNVYAYDNSYINIRPGTASWNNGGTAQVFYIVANVYLTDSRLYFTSNYAAAALYKAGVLGNLVANRSDLYYYSYSRLNKAYYPYFIQGRVDIYNSTIYAYGREYLDRVNVNFASSGTIQNSVFLPGSFIRSGTVSANYNFFMDQPGSSWSNVNYPNFQVSYRYYYDEVIGTSDGNEILTVDMFKLTNDPGLSNVYYLPFKIVISNLTGSSNSTLENGTLELYDTRFNLKLSNINVTKIAFNYSIYYTDKDGNSILYKSGGLDKYFKAVTIPDMFYTHRDNITITRFSPDGVNSSGNISIYINNSHILDLDLNDYDDGIFVFCPYEDLNSSYQDLYFNFKYTNYINFTVVYNGDADFNRQNQSVSIYPFSTINVDNVHVGDTAVITGVLANFTVIGFVNVTVDGKVYSDVVVDFVGGNWTVSHLTNHTGTYNVTVSYIESDIGNFTGFSNSTSFEVSKLASNSSIVIPVDIKVNETVLISGVLSDENNNTISGANLEVIVDGETFNVTTDSVGVWGLNYTPEHSGVFNLSLFYQGDSRYVGFVENMAFNVSKLATTSSINIPSNVKVGKSISVSGVLTSGGKPLANRIISVIVDGKTYKVTTNGLGVWKLSYTPKIAGKSTMKVYFAGNDVFAGFNVSKTFKVVGKAKIRIVKISKLVKVGKYNGFNLYSKIYTIKNLGSVVGSKDYVKYFKNWYLEKLSKTSGVKYQFSAKSRVLKVQAKNLGVGKQVKIKILVTYKKRL